MGKGDKKSKRGKIIIGSFGVSRRRKNKKKSGFIKPVVKKEAPVKVQAPKEIVKEEVNNITEEVIVETPETNSIEVAETAKKTKPKAAKKETEKKEPAKKKTTKKEKE